MRCCVAWLLLGAVLCAAEPFADAVKPLLRGQCGGCHGGKTPAGGFAVSELLTGTAAESLRLRERWERVAQRMRAGEMPPAGPLPAAQVSAVVDWVTRSYAELDRTAPIDPGRVTARRLNRNEYSNSVRDLLGLDLNAGEDLPIDPYGYGFDNIGDVLTMNAGLTEQYLKAAERVARTAIPVPGEKTPAVMQRYLAERLGQDRQLRMRVDHVFPVAGQYTLRTAFYQALKDGTRVRMRLLVDGKEAANEVLQFYYQIDRAVEAKGVRVTAGRHRVEASIEVLAEPVYKGALPYLEYLEVYGPVEGTAEPERRLLVCDEKEPGCAKQVLAPLARRAWRRPVTPLEMDGLLGVAAAQGIRSGLMAILVSPHFLFRVERDRGAGSQKLSGYELATRLSYFLWGSLPDEELMALAEKGSLDGVVGAQARRMMRDERAAGFVDSFAGQWLQTRNLAVLKPDVKKFPVFTGELASDMRTETHQFFSAILREDRSILDFVDGGFTFLNERLAKHYGIAGVSGEEFRRVELDGVQRGGVLGHGSVLTVSSYPTRTSPVIRGKWVLENLLNQPPPPPPPNVPGLDEKAATAGGSMREQLERHRTNAMCAACHSRMDPLGFGLENYDAIGRWREEDASGVLPGGARFSTPAEMKKILKAEPDVFARALTEKVLTYALGRGLELRDRAAVARIVDRVRRNGYRFSELIVAVVESEPFRRRRAEGGSL